MKSTMKKNTAQFLLYVGGLCILWTTRALQGLVIVMTGIAEWAEK